MTEKQDAEWVKESVIETVRREGGYAASGAWVAIDVEGSDKIDVFKFTERVNDD